MTVHQVVVMGTPVQKGSLIPAVTKSGRPFVREKSDHKGRLTAWRTTVHAALHNYRGTTGASPFICPTGPVAVRLDFVMPLRKTDRPVPGQIIWHSVSPDLDKLTRTILDCMTAAGSWTDDGQCAYLLATATRGPDPHVLIEWTSL